MCSINNLTIEAKGWWRKMTRHHTGSFKSHPWGQLNHIDIGWVGAKSFPEVE
jgi:hypothetical protein